MAAGKATTGCQRASICALLSLVLFCSAALASSESSSYQSVRTLNKFGNSEQLTYAREAARRYGRSIIAANSAENATVVVSIGSKPVVQRLTLPSVDDQEPTPVAICCTGIRGDATWLVSEVRTYLTRAWDRYDVHMDASSISYIVARLLGSWIGDDIDVEWQPTVPREQQIWGRPMGIQALIVSPGSGFFVVEPSGRLLKPNVYTKADESLTDPCRSCAIIGKDAEVLARKIRRLDVSFASSSTEQLVDELVSLLSEELDREPEAQLYVEIFSQDQYLKETIRLQRGKRVEES